MATARTVYRDFSTDGVPSSGKHTPKKSDIREYLTGLETIINAFTSSGGLVYQTRAALYADLAHGANSMAWVTNDADPTKNGIYQKIGATGAGSWVRVADLPHGLIVASDVGAGTPNAIEATTATTVTEAALVLLGVFEANTGSPVTVSFNGGAALTIKTAAGGDMPADGLTAGLAVLGRMSGNTFRLLSDYDSAANVAAAETARDLAKDFANKAENSPVTTGQYSALHWAKKAEQSAIDAEAIAGFNPSNYAPLASPVFSGTPKAPTPAVTAENKLLANTAFVQAAIEAGIKAALGDLLAETHSTRAWTPADLDGALWLDATVTASITASAGRVSAVEDLSPSNNDLVQATSGKQPLLSVGALNGLDALAFSGTRGDVLAQASANVLSGKGRFTAFAVAQVAGYSTIQSILMQDTETTRICQFIRINTAGKVEMFQFFYSGNFSAASPDSVELNKPFLATTIWDNEGLKAGLNGVMSAAATPGDNGRTGTAPLTVGASSRTSSAPLTGYIGEVILVPYQLTSEDRQRVEGYLAWKWGLVDKLPASHRYKVAPPTTIEYSTPKGAKTIEGYAAAINDNVFATPLAGSASTVYAVYMTPSLITKIARSTDGGSTWTSYLLDSTRILDDAHCTASVGIDRDGYLHASYGMHATDFYYRVSTNPGDPTSWVVKNTMTGADETLVSYPQFFNSPVTGALYFAYRTGTSVSGKYIINVYDEVTKTWARLGGVAVVLDGTAKPAGPYPNPIVFDAADNVILTFTWRYNQKNEDYFYAKFDRAAGAWKKLDGSTYTMPITFDTTGGKIVDTNLRFINQCNTCIDSNGVIHIAYPMDDANAQSQIWHTSVSGTTVTTTQMTHLDIPIVISGYPDLSRPLIWTEGGSLWCLFTDGGTGTASNYQNPPGQAYIVQSADGLVGAAWGPAKKIRMLMRCSEFGMDWAYLQQSGHARIFAQTTEKGAGPIYMFTLPALLGLTR